MSKAKALLNLCEANAAKDFADKAKKIKGVIKVTTNTVGSDNVPTIDVKFKDDTFTIDYIEGKGFFWMDFNKEQLLGKDATKAVAELERIQKS